MQQPIGTVRIMRDVSLIGIEQRSAERPSDVVGRAFLALERLGVKVLLISQSSAAGNFCFVIPSEQAQVVMDTLSQELNVELSRRDITRLWTSDSTIVAGIELRLANTLCERLAEQGIGIPVMVQSAATQSVSLVVEHRALPQVMYALACA
ncbi:MAG: hypothetical protein IT324_25035 [Anaerolineae bacterium]|nr:hypothetical protein [Anaerolineae bacterium]